MFENIQRSVLILIKKNLIFLVYQPGWTLAAGGVKNADSFRKPESQMIPKGVDWIKTKASKFQPESNTIILDNGEKVKYDFLVMAAGIQINFDGVNRLFLESKKKFNFSKD